ncbi:hypothetical protein I3843_07G191300 [Carya illinoinensis]|uniref:GDSL esterase/lipase n=1 Tax=Carya illinoinensis TaxID=32201 RepID=A0A922JFW8_CARIL|nr:hypothetical protein I3760_07G192400 [Carya illinoinensis]KAG6705803.1 hypothetical protein I3842_07G197500 [Carya illinoinensis]KAG7972583.1 hypothetical protein I3843_07G191300 [Carya illinoinensis]
MACSRKISSWKLLIVFFLASNSQHDLYYADAKPQVPCFFIFGDSIADNGNNNNLNTTIKVKYLPYGIDFPGGVTGRFTNGRTPMDFLAEFMGFDHYIPPFATASGPEILEGVNYASGGAGIRNETGQFAGDRISMDRQLENHKTTVSRIVKMLGNRESAMDYLSKCIYAVAIGSNDYFNNYFIPVVYPTHFRFTPSQYATVLRRQFSQQLKTLHKYGARKVAVHGLDMPRCTLFRLSICAINEASCMAYITNAITLWNDELKPMVAGLSRSLPDANFIFINFTGITTSIVNSQGFNEDINFPCCQVYGAGNIIPLNCKSNGNVCSNRSQYAFFDAVHPTEALYELQTRRTYRAQSPTDSYPFDIEHLVQL